VGAAGMAAGIGLYLWRTQQPPQTTKAIAMPAAAAAAMLAPQLTRQKSEPRRMRKPAQHSDYDLSVNEQHRKELQLEIAVNKFLYSKPSPDQEVDRVDALFDKSDTDNDGKVDKKELRPLLSSILDDFKVTSKLVTDDRSVLDAAIDEAYKKSSDYSGSSAAAALVDASSSSSSGSTNLGGSFTKKEFREYAEQFLLSILSRSRSPTLPQ